jgi:hypothetical protein
LRWVGWSRRGAALGRPGVAESWIRAVANGFPAALLDDCAPPPASAGSRRARGVPGEPAGGLFGRWRQIKWVPAEKAGTGRRDAAEAAGYGWRRLRWSGPAEGG